MEAEVAPMAVAAEEPVSAPAVDEQPAPSSPKPTRNLGDEAEVLMASPIVIRQPAMSDDAVAAAPVPDALTTPQPPPQEAEAMPQDTADGALRQYPLFAVAQQNDMLTPSPLAAMASPQPIAASPFQMDFNHEAPVASPPPAAMSPGPLPIAASPLVIGMPAVGGAAPSPAPVASPLPAATPASYMSDYNHIEPEPSPMMASFPATPLAAPEMDDTAVEGVEVPADEALAGSPISLSQEHAALTPAPVQQEDEPAEQGEDDMMDADMGDGGAETPLTFVSDRRSTPLPSDPSPIMFGPPGSVPHSAAAGVPRSSNVSFQGFGGAPCVDSPSLQGLVAPAINSSPYMQPSLSPMEEAGSIPPPMHAAAATPGEDTHPRAPACTPEVGPVPTWTLANTPLQCGIAAAAEALSQLPTTPSAFDATDAMEQEQTASPISLSGEPIHASEPEAAPVATTPIAAQTSSKSVMSSRSPLPGSSMRPKTPGAKPTPGSKPTPVLKPVTPGAAKAVSPYVHVESRYNKTPVTAAAVSKPAQSQPLTSSKATPVAPTNAAAGAKSVKRVSIHTPEGPRSAAPQRKEVVPTPYRPATARAQPQTETAETVAAESSAPSQPAEDAMMEQASDAAVAPTASAAAEQRRAQAAERLKAIHATETGTASTPGYLQTTHAFAVKTAKTVKSKVDASSYDPRSLRQLKKEVKELTAKKAKGKDVGLAEVRSSKLTPNVKETELPLPVDDEGSDIEAEYNEAQENELTAAMAGLEVAAPKNGPMPLRGLPAPKGRHLRFGETGAVSESPQRVVLRGLPVATGKYKRFE
ncbi:hypothetical protein GPECTOR_32g448 [Gonium pectorale]|uniref:Uncharacterized protein n=1 Tax=Gonium pectorale TaxID=33097 RepID=A0A150GDC5_GONPE|nr:hypothetical protein GPECTOR_32g448 [Gonium pectorale]|eukprot:KXZ47836.1 hypothetical protein GPECTOR_32g448 [Gonium pectorale]